MTLAASKSEKNNYFKHERDGAGHSVTDLGVIQKGFMPNIKMLSPIFTELSTSIA